MVPICNPNTHASFFQIDETDPSRTRKNDYKKNK